MNKTLVVLEVKDSVSKVLTLSTDLASRLFPFTNFATNTYVSVSKIEISEVVTSEYYSIDGLRVVAPKRGEIYIRMQKLSDGRFVISKILF